MSGRKPHFISKQRYRGSGSLSVRYRRQEGFPGSTTGSGQVQARSLSNSPAVPRMLECSAYNHNESLRVCSLNKLANYRQGAGVADQQCSTGEAERGGRAPEQTGSRDEINHNTPGHQSAISVEQHLTKSVLIITKNTP